MAIDTAAKRLSMLNLGSGGAPLPLPDGTIEASDRQHLLGAYSGVPFEVDSSGIPVTPEERHHYWMRRQGSRGLGLIRRRGG